MKIKNKPIKEKLTCKVKKKKKTQTILCKCDNKERE